MDKAKAKQLRLKNRRARQALSCRSKNHEAAMQENNVMHEGHIYPDSVHGFFNDATPERYNQTTAEEAWTRTIAWFNQHTREAV